MALHHCVQAAELVVGVGRACELKEALHQGCGQEEEAFGSCACFPEGVEKHNHLDEHARSTSTKD